MRCCVFKTVLRSSGQVDCSMWACIIMSRCFSLCPDAGSVPACRAWAGGIVQENAPHHTVWGWEQTLLVWSHSTYTPPGLGTPNNPRNLQLSSRLLQTLLTLWKHSEHYDHHLLQARYGRYRNLWGETSETKCYQQTVSPADQICVRIQSSSDHWTCCWPTEPHNHPPGAQR